MSGINLGYEVMGALALFICASVWLGIMAERRIEKSKFLSGYFLGNRGLGAWALALTATVQSGGTFMGFPSLVYAHGWIVALWIAGYMVVPLTGFAILGKRFAQLSRLTGAITVPDLFRDRYRNSTVGLAASLLIILFMSTMMIAQFKAGAIVMKLAWPGSGTLALSEDFSEEDKAGAKSPGGAARAATSDSGEAAPAAKSASDTKPDAKRRAKPAAHASAKSSSDLDYRYYTGLIIFTVTVVGYTLVGGFLAGVWTDLFQSVMMFIGVMILLFLAVPRAGGLEQATRTAVEYTGPAYAAGPGHEFRPAKPGDKSEQVRAVARTAGDGAAGAAQSADAAPDAAVDAAPAAKSGAASAPGAGETLDIYRSDRDYLPIGLAVSFFFVWVFSGLGSPAGMVRVMASENTEVIRKSIFMLSVYNCCIYIPLICICIAGRALLPDLDKPDEIVPRLAILLPHGIPGGSLLTGLILAAPFGAVMATVSCYLLVIASGLVKDIYLRFIRPHAHEAEIRRVTYACMILVGAVAILANIKPVKFLQALVVFSGASGAATFVTPALMAAFWRRATAAGSIAAMLCGAGTMCLMYLTGWIHRAAVIAAADPTYSGIYRTIADVLGPDRKIGLDGPFRPYYLGGLDPILWGLGISLVAGVTVSLLTSPPPKEHVSLMFGDAAQAPAR